MTAKVAETLTEAIGADIFAIAPSCKGAMLLDGKVFKGNVGHQELAAWVEGLGL